jgi:hypothetical protein
MLSEYEKNIRFSSMVHNLRLSKHDTIILQSLRHLVGWIELSIHPNI